MSNLKHFDQNLKRLMIAAMALIFLLCSGFDTFADDTDTLIDRAMKLSGISSQIDTLGRTILSAVPADVFPDQKARNEAEAFMRKKVSKESINDLVRSAVREKLGRDNLDVVVKFYETNLGRKVGRIQENATEAGLIKNIREGRKVVVSLDEDRLKIIRRIIDAEKVGQTNDNLVTNVVRGILEGSAEGSNAGNESEEIRSKLKAVEKTLAAEQHRMDDTALTAYALTYRSLSDKELEEFANFHESAASAWFRDAVRVGLSQVVLRISSAFGEALSASRNSGISDRNAPASAEPSKRRDRDG